MRRAQERRAGDAPAEPDVRAISATNSNSARDRGALPLSATPSTVKVGRHRGAAGHARLNLAEPVAGTARNRSRRGRASRSIPTMNSARAFPAKRSGPSGLHQPRSGSDCQGGPGGGPARNRRHPVVPLIRAARSRQLLLFFVSRAWAADDEIIAGAIAENSLLRQLSVPAGCWRRAEGASAGCSRRLARPRRH